MGVKEKILKVNEQLANWLNAHYISATSDETTFDLIKKLDNIVPFMASQLSIKPWRDYTEYPAYEDLSGNILADPGAKAVWNDDGSVTAYSLVDPSNQVWPHIRCTYPDNIVDVSGLRWLIDTQYNHEFNASIVFQSANGLYGSANLTQMAGYEGVDFSEGRTSLKINLGKWVIDHCNHTNPPKVTIKNDLLEKVCGTAINYNLKGGKADFGQIGTVGTPLNLTVDLTETPYLYYSIRQESASGCTFGLYGDSPWFMYREGANSNTPAMETDSTKYTGSANWIFGEQCGCINLKDYIDADTYTLYGLRFYGNELTDANFNYLFFGNAPTEEKASGWGNPATPTYPIKKVASVGGELKVESVNYWIVGSTGSYVQINNSYLAQEFIT